MSHALRLLTLSAAVALGAVAPAPAEEGTSHYIAEPSETLEQAVTNFVTYNRKLRDVMARDPLSVEDMEEVHELTYTLELALAKINEEMGALPVILEEVHIASEGDNPQALRGVAEVYLESALALDR